ncbi:MAG: hypothetical protein U0R64_05235 [Candidatus Nanopelagicales bacterium]
MAEPLKDRFDDALVGRLAARLAPVVPDLDVDSFVTAATADFPDLELSQRAQAVASALADVLPADPATAIDLIRRSTPEPADTADWPAWDAFMMWPLTIYVAEHGQGCFEESMAAQHALTQVFTCEFSIRAFLIEQPLPTLARLSDWVRDPSEHVRRLVSEGTRPRLPWASRLPEFVADPAPILPLLEALRDDPSEYVRRSVANNLNDIAKDHPDVTLAVAERWLAEDPGRRSLVRHGLRTLVKAGDSRALAVLGYGPSPVMVSDLGATPAAASIGDSLRIETTLHNPTGQMAPVLVDLVVAFPRPGKAPRRKVFVAGEHEIGAHATRTIRRSVSLAQLSTRRVYPGTHTVEVVVNGVPSGSLSVDVAP